MRRRHPKAPQPAPGAVATRERNASRATHATHTVHGVAATVAAVAAASAAVAVAVAWVGMPERSVLIDRETPSTQFAATK